jgi:HEAT repeat protein
MLAASREQLLRNIASEAVRPSLWEKLRRGFTIHVHPIPAGLQPVGALALVAMGFFGARMLPPSMLGLDAGASGLAPVASRVRYVEPEASGKVKMVVEEIHERSLTGNIDDQNIQALLLAAARDPQNAGLRVESVDLLKSSRECPEVKNALLYSLQHDSNPGVRLKALEGLKNSSADPQVRQVLTQVLLADDNPGVRTQAIDLLIQHKEDRMVGVLQELMRHEDNGYVRLRCQKALHDMNASVETY